MVTTQRSRSDQGRAIAAVALSKLLRQHGSFDSIPGKYKNLFERRIEPDGIVITPKNPEAQAIFALRRTLDITEEEITPKALPQNGNNKYDADASKWESASRNQPKPMSEFKVGKGWYALDENNQIMTTRSSWTLETATEATRFMVIWVVSKDPERNTNADGSKKSLRDIAIGINYNDFSKNGLWHILERFMEGSPSKAVDIALPELKIKPWERAYTPRRFYQKLENRVEIVKWLVDKLPDKDPRHLQARHFRDNHLGGLLNYYGKSVYKAVAEAYPELDIKPWEMTSTPKHFYEKAENRRQAIRWLAEVKLKKDPTQLEAIDFRDNGLDGLLKSYYKATVYNAVSDAYPERNLKPWHMKKIIQGYFNKAENRAQATEWILEQRGKEQGQLKPEDFMTNPHIRKMFDRYYEDRVDVALEELNKVRAARKGLINAQRR